MPKWTMRAFVALGYQVEFKILQAMAYGSPQNRRRCIFFASRRGLPAPLFPVPTHYNDTAATWATDTPYGKQLRHPTRTMTALDGSIAESRSAPLAAVTVGDAISDLPPFHWSTSDAPHDPSTDGIPSFNPDSGKVYPGFPQAEPYATPVPTTAYQMWCRQGNGTKCVTFQYTPSWGGLTARRVVRIPFTSNGSMKDLSDDLRTNRFLSGKKNDEYHYYRRLQENEQFLTIMTSLHPSRQKGRLLHYNQKRVITIREAARAQGFPDTYVFKSAFKTQTTVVEDQMRQIGNAVPVPLALALGRSLGKMMLNAQESEDEG